jgi:hypothetical protein
MHPLGLQEFPILTYKIASGPRQLLTLKYATVNPITKRLKNNGRSFAMNSKNFSLKKYLDIID